MPTLLLMGAKDVMRDADKIAARLQPLLPHLHPIILPEGGHALMNTTAQIVPFLAAVNAVV